MRFLALVMFGISLPVSCSDDLLPNIFEKMKEVWAEPKPYHVIHRNEWHVFPEFELKDDQAPRVVGDGVRAYEFWQKNKHYAPDDSAIHTYGLSSDGKSDEDGYIGAHTEVWDFNADSIEDFFLKFTASTGHCNKYAVLVSQGRGYDHYGDEDLVGDYVDDSSLCESSFPNFFKPVDINGKVYWVFSEGTGEAGTLRQFDFRKPKGSSVIAQLFYTSSATKNGLEYDGFREKECVSELCIIARQKADPIIPNPRQRKNFERPDTALESTLAILSKYNGVEKKLGLDFRSGKYWITKEILHDFSAHNGEKVQILELGIRSNSHEFGRLFMPLVSEGRISGYLLVDQDIGKQAMLKNPSAYYNAGYYDRYLGNYTVITYENSKFIMKIGEHVMGWRRHCCGVSLYSFDGVEFDNVANLSLTPAVGYQITIEGVEHD